MKAVFRMSALSALLGTFLLSGCDSSESEDVTLPNVTITEPADGQWLDGATPFFIRVNASELSGIASVRFSVDGVFVGEDTSRPYEIRWDPSARADNQAHVIAATALDTEGDEATAEISVGLHTLLDTWTVIGVTDENGDQTVEFLGSSVVLFAFSETGSFTVNFVDSGTGGIRGFNGSYKANSGGVGSSLSMDFQGAGTTTRWEALYTWDDEHVVIEGPADELNSVLLTTLVGVARITLETPDTLD